MDKALVASAVVVWEWLGERGRWRPYSPAVSRHIEEVIRSESRGGSVVLGQADSRLSPYIIDIQSMHQFRQDTGTLRPVRRSFYDPTSAPGQGWIWEWENDKGSWTPFDMEVTIALQVARERQQPCLDLTSLGFNHLVDFQTMTQINRQTQTQRRVQRRLDSVYPLISGPLPKSSGANASTKALLGVGVSGSMLYKKSSAPSGSSLALPGLPCACPQCLLVQSVKANANGSQTLGRSRGAKRSCPKQFSGTLPSSSASLTTLNSKSHLQNAKSLDSSFLEEANHPTVFDRSLALLNTRSLSPGRPVLRSQPHLPSPAPKSPSSATFVPTAILVNTSPDDTSHSTSLPSQRPTASAAPLPARASLARLSPPALRRIAMAQSQALISSGVPTIQVKNLEGSGSVRPALAGITGILMSAAGLPVCLTRPLQPDLNPPPVSKSDIKPVPGITSCCRKISKKQVCKGKTPEEVVKTFLQKVKMPPDEDCIICMGSLLGPSGYMGLQISSVSRAEHVAKLAQCGHLYHLQCLVTMYVNGNKDGSLQCPTCKTIYGVKMGNQPPGKMEYHVIPHSLPGHPDCRTIRIIYNIPPGLQSPEHPNPGKPFTSRGFPRHCYLPDSEKGRKVLRLLLSAWDRRMIFSVATSSTTGEPDTVIWNDIHHKTEFGSNFTGHGYPDSGYLDNVLEELKAQGITEELGKQP